MRIPALEIYDSYVYSAILKGLQYIGNPWIPSYIHLEPQIYAIPEDVSIEKLTYLLTMPHKVCPNITYDVFFVKERVFYVKCSNGKKFIGYIPKSATDSLAKDGYINLEAKVMKDLDKLIML